MRTLLLLIGVTTLTSGCGRKAPPVADNAPPKVERQPRVPANPGFEVPLGRPVGRPVGRENDDTKVADADGPRPDVPAFEIPPVVRPEGPKAAKPVVEEEEEPIPQRRPAPAVEPLLPRRVEPIPAEGSGLLPVPLPAPPMGIPDTGMKPLPPPARRIEQEPVPQPPMRIEPRPTQPQPVARKPVTEQDMKDIHTFVDTNSLAGGKMPPPALIFGALGAAGSPAAKLVASGDIILTGARQRESCWAYQKGAATDGGWIVTNNGAEQVDAATAKRWITGR